MNAIQDQTLFDSAYDLKSPRFMPPRVQLNRSQRFALETATSEPTIDESASKTDATPADAPKNLGMW